MHNYTHNKKERQVAHLFVLGFFWSYSLLNSRFYMNIQTHNHLWPLITQHLKTPVLLQHTSKKLNGYIFLADKKKYYQPINNPY